MNSFFGADSFGALAERLSDTVVCSAMIGAAQIVASFAGGHYTEAEGRGGNVLGSAKSSLLLVTVISHDGHAGVIALN
jgi:hypothetical protein